MASFIIKILLTALAALAAAYVLDHVYIDNVWTALIVAGVLGLLNAVVKPLMILFTLPLTLITFGLFLLVINILIVQLADYLVPGFRVQGWWAALLFGIIVSIVRTVLESLFTGDTKRN